MLRMTEIIESHKVLKVFPSFILGKCRCGCNEDIPIRSTGRTLAKYKFGHNFVGKNNPSFNNGVSNNREYIIVYDPDHVHADSKGFVRRNIKVFTDHHLCCLLPWSRIHHKDGNKKNDDISNLEGMTWRQHGQHHNPQQDHSHKRCKDPDCKTPNITRLDKNGSPMWYGSNEDGWLCRKCYNKHWMRKKVNKLKLL
jgi:hypothetical protein